MQGSISLWKVREVVCIKILLPAIDPTHIRLLGCTTFYRSVQSNFCNYSLFKSLSIQTFQWNLFQSHLLNFNPIPFNSFQSNPFIFESVYIPSLCLQHFLKEKQSNPFLSFSLSLWFLCISDRAYFTKSCLEHPITLVAILKHLWDKFCMGYVVAREHWRYWGSATPTSRLLISYNRHNTSPPWDCDIVMYMTTWEHI